MRTFRFIPFSAVLLLGLGLPAYSSPQTQTGTPALPSQQQLGDAYQSGYNHGQADAGGGVPRSDQPGDNWTTEEARRAYREGYSAGYSSVPVGHPSAATSTTGSAMARPADSNVPGAARFGYDDGIAAGHKDRDSGHPFKPTDSDMYKHGDHGWTADFGAKDHYRQLYRQSYTQGYQDGYGSNQPQ